MYICIPADTMQDREYVHYIVKNTLRGGAAAVPKKQKSLISYFFEDARKSMQSPVGHLQIFGTR